ncbi:porin family protein [Lacinutrix sp. C3R15]|uniref:outer membrane beta-barrel protein n=1 Tax=Flavobacteriaceae TaxID=49546 RepID=UPI001C0877A2|nr:MULTISPECIES: outer membrane beta-barrel protein [Flavobacteriaceae]MBU2938195.1 porin family protein [Lacinutrix sp. C3R15]MDO6621509.1 outer membrane beta-barrel protein [Oceanihabitans sp. 1_MG-2023]
MKNYCFLFILFFVFNIAFSQETKDLENEKLPVFLGFRTGANASNLSYSDLDYRIGGYFGVFLNFKTSHLYRLQLEIGYSSQGGTSTAKNTNGLQVDYFTISAVNKFYLKNSGFHFLVYPSIELDVDGSTFGDDKKNGVTDIDIALGAGFGYAFNNNLIIETRFKHGLLDTDIQLFNNNDTDMYNIVFQLGVSYKFKIKD